MQMTLDNLFCAGCYRMLKHRIKRVGTEDINIPYGTTNNIRSLVNFVRWIYAKEAEPEDHSLHSTE